jgi:hypothetical protein
MSPQTKLALRRFALRWLRKLFDWLEERLYAAEVKLRNELAEKTVQTEPPSDKGALVAGSLSAPYKAPKTTRQRRRHVTASAFDLRFSR